MSQVCEMCALLLQELGDIHFTDDSQQHRVIVRGDAHMADADAPYACASMRVLVEKSDTRAYLRVYSQPGVSYLSTVYGTKADDRADNEAATSGDVAGRPLDVDPISDRSLKRMSSWLRECSQKHSGCDLERQKSRRHNTSIKSLTELRPSRLLDVGDLALPRSKCRLVAGTDAKQDYAALSYCWGKTPQLKTLEGNISSHQADGIKLEDLPRTISDAIIITRKLGFRYLWVDALCIVQDDLDDWKREGMRMGLTYREAFVTIVAAGSDSSTGGILIERGIASPEVTIIYQPEPRGKQSNTQQKRANRPRTMHISPYQHNFVTDVVRSAWNTRGWTLQERNLSRRLVIFGAGQTFFECREYSLAEDGGDLRNYQGKRLGQGVIPQGRSWDWCLLVQDFTARNLSYVKDRLIAIDGLARFIAEKDAEVGYCAGAFLGKTQDEKAFHTIWYHTGSIDTPRAAQNRLLGRQRAPSWSWGSVDGQVRWDARILEAEKDATLSFLPRFAGLSPVDESICKAILSYQGRVTELHRCPKQESYDLGGQYGHILDILSQPACFPVANLDGKRVGWGVFDEIVEESQELWGASVLRTEKNRSHNTSVVVIILRRDTASSNYVRVGMGELIMLEKLGLEKRSLNIV